MAQGKVNIPSTITDVNYRYKMPKMILKIEGNGNGIKTNITNLGDVANALDVDPEYILKFFGFEKATLTHYKANNAKDMTTIINGAFSNEDMMKVLDKFIDKYVCCPKCTYPEMHMKVEKYRLRGECDSCGYNGELDNIHKIASFIIKKPPVAKNEIKKDKPDQKPKKGAEAEVVEETKEEMKKRKAKKLGKYELPLESPQLYEMIDILRNVFQYKSQTIKDPYLLSAEISDQLKKFCIYKTLYDRLSYLIFNCIFTINILNEVKEFSKLYKILLDKFSVPNSYIDTILNFQYTIMHKNKDEAKRKIISTVLLFMYQEDLLSDKTVLKWDEGGYEVVADNFLFNKYRNEVFKTHAKDFLAFVKQPDEYDYEEYSS